MKTVTLAAANGEPAPELMDKEFLYQNLFNPNVTDIETYNNLAENCLKVITNLVETNASK